jgi:TonB family protein
MSQKDHGEKGAVNMRTQREILFRRAMLAVVFMAVGSLYAPEAVSAQDAVYQAAELTEQPRIADARQARSAILRSYSARLQEAGVEGRVEVAFVVNIDGSVDEASVKVMKSPAEGLSQAAEIAVKKLKFQPGRKDGQAVRCQVMMPIQYSVGD